ncbi:MAG: hypothetical protein Q9174_000151 [Haloplaca sp. 1 TL-2023]
MGSNVVSVGTRHVKVWRLESSSSPTKARRGADGSIASPMSRMHHSHSASPVPKTFSGRNCLLGSLQDATFTCVVGISDELAVVCTQGGSVCLLDDSTRSQRLNEVRQLACHITCVALDRSSNVVWIGGKNNAPQAISLDVFLAARGSSPAPDDLSKSDASTQVHEEGKIETVAICSTGSKLLVVDKNRGMFVHNVLQNDGCNPETAVSQRLPAHNTMVLGVVLFPQPNGCRSDFLTYSEDGCIVYWLWEGKCTKSYFVPLGESMAAGSVAANSLRSVRISQPHGTILAGDNTGTLHLLDSDGKPLAAVKAHEGEVHDIALRNVEESISVAATCGRDRTIQIFKVSEDECSIQQSLLQEHAGSVRRLELANDASILASMSSDRTIVLHSQVLRSDGTLAFVATKTITLKASPTALSLSNGASYTLLVSTADRYVREISLTQGDNLRNFKTNEHPHGESIVLNRISVTQASRGTADEVVLAGFSLTDGSVRVYDVETGLLTAAVQGQTAISDLAIANISESAGDADIRIVSTAFDGTVTVWKVMPRSQLADGRQEHDGAGPTKLQPTATLRPLRRVLSKGEIAKHQRSLKNQGSDTTVLSRSSSPRPKPSRALLEDTFKPVEMSADTQSLQSSMGIETPLTSSLHDPQPLSPEARTYHRVRRLSMDERHRSDGRDRTSSLDSAAKHMCDSLQDFRRSVVSTKKSLSSARARALQTELQLTLTTITQGPRRIEVASELMGNESFDEYLAKLIDDRLAIRLKSEDQTSTTEGSRDREHLFESNTDVPGQGKPRNGE